MENYSYQIEKGESIRHCMRSKLREKPYVATPAPYPSSYYINQPWHEVISPARTEFEQQAEFEKRSEEIYDCDELYFPLEGEKVEYNAFWSVPTVLDFAAAFTFHTQVEGEYEFLLESCSSIKVYLEGQLVTSKSYYLRNQEYQISLQLKLKAGENTLYIQGNDLAERDTAAYIKLIYESELPLTASLPYSVDKERLEEKKALLDQVYLEKLNYTEDAIYLIFPQKEEPLEVEISLGGQTKDVCIAPGETKVYIGDLLSRKVGIFAPVVSTYVNGLKLTQTLFFEYYDERVMEGMRGKDISERRKSALAFSAEHGDSVFQRTVAMLESGFQPDLAYQIMDSELMFIKNRLDCSDFRTPGLFYALDSEAVSPEYKEKITEVLLGFRYWFDEAGNDVMWFFSENHALCFHTTEYLAGERMPEAVFINSGMTGRQHQEKARKLLTDWFETFFKYGYGEWNSPVYIPVDAIGLLALYDKAKDPEMKALAKKALDYTFHIFGKNSYKGIVAASYGRIYLRNLIGRRTSSATSLNFIISGEGYISNNSYAVVQLALSDYELSEEQLKWYTGSPEGDVFENTQGQGEEQASLYSYKTPSFIMASALDFHPGEPGHQEHMFQAMIQDCETQIWVNHPGEAVIFGEGRPSYFAGNGTLPLVEQEKNHAKITFDLLDQEVDFTHAYCPIDLFDRYVLEENVLTLEKGNVKVVMTADNGLEITASGPFRNYEVISPGKKNTWNIWIEDTTENQVFNKKLK